MDLHGVFPPITTPFARDELDVGALAANVSRLMTTPLAGIVVLGSNGEAPQLDEDESERVIATARAHLPPGRVLIAGTGRESTRATLRATAQAAAAGADAVLVRTPSFFKSQMTVEVLVHHYLAVAEASSVPVILYNFTGVTGVDLPVPAVVRLSTHPNIVAVKESNSDLLKIGDLVALTPPEFAVLVGSAPTFYASLCVGAAGGILALACVAPEACCELYALTKAGRHAEALALQQRIAPLARAVTSQYGVPGLKAALDLAGYRGGDPRPPLLPAPVAAVGEIRQHLAALQLSQTSAVD